MAILEDGRHRNGITNAVLKNGQSIDLSGLASATSSGSPEHEVKIIALLWSTDSTGLTISYNADGSNPANDSFTVYGGGTWTRFNGFDGLISKGTAALGDISVSGNGILYITVKKLGGYDTHTAI